MGIETLRLEVGGPEGFEAAFEAASRAGVGALVSLIDVLGVAYPARIAELAAGWRLPAMYGSRDVVDAGGLMAYGPNNADVFRQAATHVDRVLRGARPADLPVEQPTKFDFAINLKTAQALGLTIPRSVLMQATEVIQ